MDTAEVKNIEPRTNSVDEPWVLDAVVAALKAHGSSQKALAIDAQIDEGQLSRELRTFARLVARLPVRALLDLAKRLAEQTEQAIRRDELRALIEDVRAQFHTPLKADLQQTRKTGTSR